MGNSTESHPVAVTFSALDTVEGPSAHRWNRWLWFKETEHFCGVSIRWQNSEGAVLSSQLQGKDRGSVSLAPTRLFLEREVKLHFFLFLARHWQFSFIQQT